jgi:hypothetical protein
MMRGISHHWITIGSELTKTNENGAKNNQENIKNET